MLLFAKLLALIVFISIATVITSAAVAGQKLWKTSKSSRYIYDDDNRVSIFRGTNFVMKSFPWYPAVLLDMENVRDLASWGHNTVRLGFMWTGAEPAAGQFNRTYFDLMGRIVDNLNSVGIYPFIDVHQDVLSSEFCLYDGAPTWVVDKAEPATNEFPWPLKPTYDDGSPNPNCPYSRPWFQNYFLEGCGKAFEGIYNNHNGMRDDFSNFYRETAEFFKDKNILGYEILNEPWAGDIYSRPELLLPGKAGSLNLMPFYDVVVHEIRKADTNHIILYEPVTWGMIFNGEIIGTGFDKTPADSPELSALSFHYYCWWITDEEQSRKTCDSLFFPKVLHQVTRDVTRTGGSAILTEWGQACSPDADPNGLGNQECYSIQKSSDDFFMSWTDWYFGGSLNDFDWNPPNVEANIRVFSRTYARSIAGTPESMSFDPITSAFSLCFRSGSADENLKLTSDITEVFANFNLYYPKGYSLTLTPNLILAAPIDTFKGVIRVKSISPAGLPVSHCLNLTATTSMPSY